MALIRMIRHGEAAAAYDEHPDPGLSAAGRAQAEGVVARLEGIAPVSIVSSPMRRAQETATPLARSWGAAVSTEPAVSEIPSPGLGPAERGRWLQGVMAGTWAETTEEVRRWRDGVAAALLRCRADTIVFSHYVAINAAISVALGVDTPRCAHLGHCSITTFATEGGALHLVEQGDEAPTVVL